MNGLEKSEVGHGLKGNKFEFERHKIHVYSALKPLFSPTYRTKILKGNKEGGRYISRLLLKVHTFVTSFPEQHLFVDGA